MAKKRKSKLIELESETLRYFSIEAAKAEKSTKAFIEELLENIANGSN